MSCRWGQGRCTDLRVLFFSFSSFFCNSFSFFSFSFLSFSLFFSSFFAFFGSSLTTAFFSGPLGVIEGVSVGVSDGVSCGDIDSFVCGVRDGDLSFVPNTPFFFLEGIEAVMDCDNVGAVCVSTSGDVSWECDATVSPIMCCGSEGVFFTVDGFLETPNMAETDRRLGSWDDDITLYYTQMDLKQTRTYLNFFFSGGCCVPSILVAFRTRPILSYDPYLSR